MKKIIGLIITVALVVSCMGIMNVSAAGSSTIHFSDNSLEVGDALTVTVKVSADETMYGVEFVLNYDPSVLEFVGGDAASGGAGIISVAAGADSNSESFNYNFKALKAGSSNIATADLTYVNYDEIEVSVPNQGSSVTVKDVTLSGNANLKSLSVNQGSLSPKFSASTTSYKVTVGSAVTECKVYATADDSNAKVQVEGASNLKVGENKCTVTVTAANGTKKVYNITIVRQKKTSSVSSTTSSEDETASDPLSAQIDGAEYTVATSLEGVMLPEGFTAATALYNEAEVAVAKDAGENYTLYYLSNESNKELVPYVLDSDTLSFKKLQYLTQGSRIYIFAETPSDFIVPDGYYATSNLISDLNVSCYASNLPELSAFYYIYCFNGSEYGFYRYDSEENVIQRYPEMVMALETDTQPEEKPEGFAERFASLSTNAKIVVIGIVALIIAVLALIVLFVFKIISNRHRAAFVNSLGYEDFDDVNYNNAFSMDNDDFITTEEDVEELDFGSETEPEEEETPDYLVDENEDVEDDE